MGYGPKRGKRWSSNGYSLFASHCCISLAASLVVTRDGDQKKFLLLSFPQRAKESEKGFVRKTRQGARQCRLASTWAVTDCPRKKGEPRSNDWRRWQPTKKQNVGTVAEQRLSDGAIIVPIERDCAA